MNIKKRFNMPLILILEAGVILVFVFVISILALRGSLTIPKVQASPSVCADLDARITAAFFSQCGDANYDPVADVNKDKIVDMMDSGAWGLCDPDEACCQGLWDATDPCPPTGVCLTLKNRLDAAWGSICGDANYDPVADVNKDKRVDMMDVGAWTLCNNDQACCQGLWDATDPCPLSSVCADLNARITAAYFSWCGDANYDPVADVNKDKIVDMMDSGAWGLCDPDEACCQGLWDATDPCASVCGNGIKEAGEDCDGADLGGETCLSLGFTGGVLVCKAGCTFDTSGCISCSSDGCNGNCPAGCTVAEDPDCGCQNGNGCCGIGCIYANDNDCAPPAFGLSNPLAAGSIEEFIEDIINLIFYLGVAIFPIMAVVGGFFFLSSGGDPAKIGTAKKILLYAVIGLLIVLFARGLIAIIKNTGELKLTG